MSASRLREKVREQTGFVGKDSAQDGVLPGLQIDACALAGFSKRGAQALEFDLLGALEFGVFFLSLGVVDGLVAESLAQGEKLGGALLELAEGFDLGAVVGYLGRVGESAGNGAPVVVLEGVESVAPASDFGAVLENGVDELFGDGAAADLIEVFDLGEKLAAASEELGGGGLNM